MSLAQNLGISAEFSTIIIERHYMKKGKYYISLRDSFYDDPFSCLSFESIDDEASYEGEIEMNNFLEDHNIEDLDISKLNDNDIDDLSLI